MADDLIEREQRHKRFRAWLLEVQESGDPEIMRGFLRSYVGGAPGSVTEVFLATKSAAYLRARLDIIEAQTRTRHDLEMHKTCHLRAKVILEPPKSKRYRRPVNEAELLRRFEAGNYYR